MENYGESGFTVMAVNGYDEDKAKVEGFVAQGRLKQKVLLMGRTVALEKYSVSKYPTSFWIDSAGKIVHRESGFSPEMFPAMEARLKRLLSEARRAAPEGAGH